MQWIAKANCWYNHLPPTQRFLTFLLPLMVAGVLNTILSLVYGFPSGLIVLIVVVILICLRLYRRI